MAPCISSAKIGGAGTLVDRLWRKRKLRADAQRFFDSGTPIGGWGPSLEALSQGRGEFAGVYESTNEDCAYLLCHVFRDEKTREPVGIEIQIENGTKHSERSQEFFQEVEGMWHMEYFGTLLGLLQDSRIRWQDPFETFERFPLGQAVTASRQRKKRGRPSNLIVSNEGAD